MGAHAIVSFPAAREVWYSIEMSHRRKLALGAASMPFFGAMTLYTLVFQAPIYQLMSHQPRSTVHLFDATPKVVAHRGFSGVAPENTLAAFHAATHAGHWMELDVTLCKTGEVVVIHDDSVDRTTNGTGEVADLTLSELQSLDAGTWFDPSFANERIPTLDEVFEVVPASQVILVELKTGDDKRALPHAVAASIERAGRGKRVIVISFDPFMLEQLRLHAPHLLRGQLVADYEDSDLAWYEKRALQNLAMTDKVQQDMVLWQHDLLDETLVSRMRSHGYPVLAWTVNEPTDIAHIQKLGVSGIISDFPDRVP